MKTLFTILLAVSITTAIAQPGKAGKHEKSSQHDRHKHDRFSGYRQPDKSYVFTAREKDGQIALINRDLDFRVRAIQENRGLKNRLKRKEIEKIELERARLTRDVITRYNDRRNRANGLYAYSR